MQSPVMHSRPSRHRESLDVNPRLRRSDNIFGSDTQWYDPAVSLVALRGAIDADNVDTLTQLVLGRALLCRTLIIDLRAVTFMAVCGYEALRLIDGHIAVANTAWTVVPSDSMRRVLGWCDPEGHIPTATSIEDALLTAEKQSRRCG